MYAAPLKTVSLYICDLPIPAKVRKEQAKKAEQNLFKARQRASTADFFLKQSLDVYAAERKQNVFIDSKTENIILIRLEI